MQNMWSKRAEGRIRKGSNQEMEQNKKHEDVKIRHEKLKAAGWSFIMNAINAPNIVKMLSFYNPELNYSIDAFHQVSDQFTDPCDGRMRSIWAREKEKK
jgi:hypothetical protein